MKRKKNNPNISPVTADVGVVNDTNTHAMVSFPTAWTGRIQTPICRTKQGYMWGSDGSNYYGGPNDTNGY